MKTQSNYIFYSFFAAIVCVISYEMLSVIKYHRKLTKGGFGLPSDSAAADLASEKPYKFIKSQLGATHTKYRSVSADLLKNVCLIGIASLFLNATLQDKLLSFSERQVSMLKRDFRNLKKSETNFLSTIALLYATTLLGISFLKSKDVDYYKLTLLSSLFVLSYFFLFPLIVFLGYLVVTNFGKKFIVACYIAYALKVLPEIIMEDTVDDNKMVKMGVDEFPEDIQEVLFKYELQDSVYKERIPGKDINAALIGYGSGKRMEIYGNTKDFSKNELYAVFLHEVGHVDEHSLLRKSVVYFIVLALECCIILFLYHKVAPKYTSPMISFFTAFVMLVFIYRVLIRQWLLGMNKVTSQLSEINSDLFTIQYGYSQNLAKTLFNIGVDAKDYLRPTTVYNSLRSTHPSIYSRVEYLKSK